MMHILISIIGLSFFNLFAFAYVVFLNNFIGLFLLWNLLTYFVFKKLYYKYFSEYKGLPIDLVLFLPGLGGVLVSITLFLMVYIKTDSLMIEDYENYIRFQNNRIHSDAFDYTASIKTMSALDVMTYYGDDLKKEIIVNYKNEFKKERIDLLRLGNLDEDTEVQHYSAVMLNALENEINSQINSLLARLKTSNNRQVLDQLLALYKIYIESSLLDEASVNIYNNIYIDLLEKRLASIEPTYQYSIDLYQAYLRQLSFKKARECYESIQEMFGETPEMLLLKTSLDFKVGDDKEMNDNINKMKEHYFNSQDQMTKKQASQLAFWIGLHGKEVSS